MPAWLPWWQPVLATVFAIGISVTLLLGVEKVRLKGEGTPDPAAPVEAFDDVPF